MGKKRSNLKPKMGRREFMQGVLVGGGALAVGLAAGKADAKPTVSNDGETAPTATDKGYHETAHIRDYYRTVGG